MNKKRLQNKIAESRFSLAVTAALCATIWLVAGFGFTIGEWSLAAIAADFRQLLYHPMVITAPLLIVTAYLMMELNNTYALIRIYSRMVSCAFLVLTTMTVFMLFSARASLVTMCAAGFYTCSFRCYQDSRSPGWVYYAFLCVGIASIVFPQVLFFVPLLWLLVAGKLFAMSLRSFCASFLGLLTPYWFLASYDIARNQADVFISRFKTLIEFYSIFSLKHSDIQSAINGFLASINLHHLITGTYIILLATIGIVHYLHTRQNDRIRTQMFYEIFIITDIAAIIFLLLQPQHFEFLIGIIIINTAPLIAHFIALTQTKWTNIAMKVLLALAAVITVFNLWEPLLKY